MRGKTRMTSNSRCVWANGVRLSPDDRNVDLEAGDPEPNGRH